MQSRVRLASLCAPMRTSAAGRARVPPRDADARSGSPPRKPRSEPPRTPSPPPRSTPGASPPPSPLASPPAQGARRRPPRTPPPRTISEHVDRKPSLSVSEFVSPTWCEYAFLYNILSQSHLPIHRRPREITTPSGNVLVPSWAMLREREHVMQLGTNVHDRIEREVHPDRMEIRCVTPEDECALLFLQFVAGTHAARTAGRAREIPVIGYVHGHLVRGIVDELHAGDTPDAPLVLSDTKTRHARTVPNEVDQTQARLQCMLYKQLVEGMHAALTGAHTAARSIEPVDIRRLLVNLELDASRPLSKVFVDDLLQFTHAFGVPWRRCDLDRPSVTLAHVVAVARDVLCRGKPALPIPLVSPRLELVYVTRASAADCGRERKVIGEVHFDAEPRRLQTYLASTFRLLHGMRAPEGVPESVAHRCSRCAWREGCEWRAQQAEAAVDRVLRARSRGDAARALVADASTGKTSAGFVGTDDADFLRALEAQAQAEGW
ncbi:hypothetical protein MSPP1_000052 [Malassezia sp. CBS 17886]|nr:hypothetical protein MSPP1_000052 [Malassezia sp. CBS 17886]